MKNYHLAPYVLRMGKRGQDRDNGAELWERVAGTTRPLKKHRAAMKPEPLLAPSRKAAKESEPAVQPRRAKQTPKPAPIPRGEALDRGTARKLERGHLAVEARLDLHGMRQREAHAALRRFLKSAQGKGYRHVLVITGKGSEPETRLSFYEEDPRGVLRQAVPYWLSAPDLAHMVVSFSAAPRRLGGEGALYVRLRKFRA
jgi:DNA-nicking Smr family endonuclease